MCLLYIAATLCLLGVAPVSLAGASLDKPEIASQNRVERGFITPATGEGVDTKRPKVRRSFSTLSNDVSLIFLSWKRGRHPQ